MSWSHTLQRWAKSLVSWKFGSEFLVPLGFFWLIVKVITFFYPAVEKNIQQLWLLFLFLVGSLVYATVMCRPRNKVSGRLNGRDVTLEVVIHDIFKLPGTLIVGSNTTFDTKISDQLISPKSIQGQFTNKFYANEQKLDLEIESQLTGISPIEELNGSRIGKKKRYKIGQVVRVAPKGIIAYLVSIAHINQHGNAQGNFEYIKEALANLWIFIGERGTRDELVLPVLGTGYSRIQETREEVIQEIIQSFVAACGERVFCEKLTIVISPSDAAKHDISIEEIGSYLRHVCKYTRYSSGSSDASGAGIAID